MQSKHCNFTSFLISFNSETLKLKLFYRSLLAFLAFIFSSRLIFFYTWIFFYFPLRIFYVQGPETPVQGPETPVQGP